MSNEIPKIITRALAEENIGFIGAGAFYLTMTKVITEMLAVAPARAQALSEVIAATKDVTKVDIVDLIDTAEAAVKENNALKAENEILKLALHVANGHLSVHEEPDSRFVNDWFVALAAVECDSANEACVRILKEQKAHLEEWLPTLTSSDLPLRRPELQISMARRNDQYPLPVDIYDNQAVQNIMSFLADRKPEQLRMLSRNMLADGADYMAAEIDDALKALTRADVAILEPVWMFTCPATGEEYELSGEERQTIANEGIYVHPDRGEIVPDFRKHIANYWGLNTNNSSYMDWKAQQAAAPGLGV